MKKILSLLLLTALFVQGFAQTNEYNLIVGTYTSPGKSEGIYTYTFNSNTADFKLRSVAKAVTNPSYLSVSKDNKFIYAVAEAPKNSAVAAFGFNGLTAELTFLNKEATASDGPCFVLSDGKNAFSANYGGGSISVFGIEENGSLTPLKQLLKHTGKSIDPLKRQEKAHAHQVQFTPDHKYVTCTDLGEDQIYIYNYHPGSKDQVLTLKSVFKTHAGTGPRHLTFSPNGKFVYLAHEFNGNITTFAYRKGQLNKIQEITTTEPGFTAQIFTYHLMVDLYMRPIVEMPTAYRHLLCNRMAN
jgi:6-phosphogluconolactonase